MQQQSDQLVWEWYRQFSHEPDKEDKREARNFFRRVTPIELSKFKREFGLTLPHSYEKFLLEIGPGYLKHDAGSNVTIARYNEFLSLPDIAALMRGEMDDWEIDPDFADRGEIPFFMESAYSVFVINQADGNIHYPSLKDLKFADTFEEFIGKLMVDCEFYFPVK